MIFLNTREAGEFLRLSPRTLETWRILGKGARFYRFGTGSGRVFYLKADLEEWALRGVRTSTSDDGQQVNA